MQSAVDIMSHQQQGQQPLWEGRDAALDVNQTAFDEDSYHKLAYLQYYPPKYHDSMTEANGGQLRCDVV